MQVSWKPLTGLAKRSAGWSKGLELPGNAEQKPFGLLTAEDGQLTMVCRGPHGWLMDAVPGEGGDFEVGVLPSALLTEVQRLHGRQEVELKQESDGGRDRFLLTAEAYRRPMLMDHLSGFLPSDQVSLSLPALGEAVEGLASAYGYQLQGVLKAALMAAPSSELNAARAVVTLNFAEEILTASSTDGRLLMQARSELEKPVDAPMQVHLETEAASRLYGLLHSVDDSEAVQLAVHSDGEQRYLEVTFEESPAVAVMPLVLEAGMPVEALLEATKGRQSLATVVVSPRTCADLTAIAIENSCVLEADEHVLKVWSRVDTDAAEEHASVAVVIAHKEIQPGRIAVDSEILSKLVRSLNGEELHFQVAVAKSGVGLLVVEQESDADVSVLAGIVALNEA